MLWTKLEEYQLVFFSVDQVIHNVRYYRSCGFLMTIATPKEYKDNSKKGLANNHAYSLLDTCIHEGHRLVLIGAPNYIKWEGKWSDLPAFNEETTSTWRNFEKKSVERRFSWMEIDDLCERFVRLSVCRYHEDWFELRTGEIQLDLAKIEKYEHQETLRVSLKRRCTFVIKLTDQNRRKRKPNTQLVAGLINIHEVTKNNQIGTLVLSHTVFLDWLLQDPEIGLVETDSFDLDPGNYFIIFNFISEKLTFAYEFTIKSSSPIDHISYDFVTFENNSASHKSLLKMIESEKCGIEIRKGLVLHEYSRDNFLLLMAENKTKDPICISVIAKVSELCLFHGIDADYLVKIVREHNGPAYHSAVYLTIPAKSKCVIGTAWTLPDGMKLEKQPKKPEISCKYWIRIFEEEMKKNKWMKKIPKELEKYIYRNTIYKPIPIE
ncbi:hypothetical protein CRE_16057 [Caenorhabditis remanei]|uniref:Calpain catalytic domain-containing protein n=1 Tax=Caenorhabditis remanei TaxID=31234 RepID=E3MBL0_CAERE|nr:hypothetical protein CRE_16057 [Caenorhabditis remanei]